jgi:hypothetical protein
VESIATLRKSAFRVRGQLDEGFDLKIPSQTVISGLLDTV